MGAVCMVPANGYGGYDMGGYDGTEQRPAGNAAPDTRPNDCPTVGGACIGCGEAPPSTRCAL